MVSSPKPPANFAYELELLTRMERVSVGGVRLVNLPLFGKYALWHRFRQYVFSSDIRRFGKTKNFDAYIAEEGSSRFSLNGFLVSLFGALCSLVSIFIAFLSSPEVILFGIDRMSDRKFKSDFRTSALYAFLKENKISYIECLHTVFDKKFLSNLFARLRPAVYLEAPDILFSILKMLRLAPVSKVGEISGLDGFDLEEERFVRHVIAKYLGEEGLIRFRVNFLKLLLKASGARAVFAIDDARYYHDISLAGLEAKVPVYAFQHGHFTKYHPGWLTDGSTLEYIRPHALVVGSDYWKGVLFDLGGVFPADSVIVGGQMRTAEIYMPEKKSESFTILIPHETDSPKKEVADILARILETMPDARVILKLRPDYSKHAQMSEYEGLPESNRVSFIGHLNELRERPALALGVYSSFLYDMVEVRVPVGIPDTSNDFGRGMVENGLADRIRTDKNMADSLRALSELPASEIEERRKHLVKPEAHLSDTLAEIVKKEGILSNRK